MGAKAVYLSTAALIQRHVAGPLLPSPMLVELQSLQGVDRLLLPT